MKSMLDVVERRLVRGVLFLAVLAGICAAQNDSVTVSSASATAGSSVALNVSLTSSSGSQPSALQWTLNYPSAYISSATTTAGAAAIAAGKSITCSGNNCVMYGLNNQTVSNGVVAVLTFKLASNATGNLGIQLTGVTASSSQANAIGVTETGGVISVGSGVGVALTPTAVTLDGSQTQQFTATVTGTSNTGVTWSLSPNVGTISSAGFYTAPSPIAAQQTVTVTATSVADPTKSATSPITLLPVIVSVSPGTTTLQGGQTQQFTAAVINTSNTGVTWSLSPNTGTITSAGLYTAPASVTSQQIVTATATSVADRTKSGAATITLTPASAQTIRFVQQQSFASFQKEAFVTFNQKTTAGDLILVGINFDKNATITSLIDSQGNTFKEVGNQLTSPGGTHTRVYYASNIKGGYETVKVVLSAKPSFLDVYLTEYSGVSTTNPIDAQSGATGHAGAVSSGSASTSTAGDLIYGFCVGDSICSAGSGYNVRSTFVTNLVEDEAAGNPGTYAATGSANQGWTMQMVALKPATKK